ncbi:MAG TPA: GntR family transcriptional regulator [Gaiellaceae bacterium]
MDPPPLLHHRVHAQLEALIISRSIAPGSRIVESDLAERLGVSRGPVREALQVLARDGFVDLRPRQGAFVHVPTAKEIDDFFEVRRVLEVESAALAAQRVTVEEAARLREAIELAEQILDAGDDPSADRERVHMHLEIARIAGNPLLEQFLSTLRRRTDWYSPPFDPLRRRRAWHTHVEIVDAIAAHDVELAKKLMAKHIDASREQFAASITGELGASTASG